MLACKKKGKLVEGGGGSFLVHCLKGILSEHYTGNVDRQKYFGSNEIRTRGSFVLCNLNDNELCLQLISNKPINLGNWVAVY